MTIPLDDPRGRATLKRTSYGTYMVQAIGLDGKVYRFGEGASRAKVNVLVDFANQARGYGTEFIGWLDNVRRIGLD